MSAFVVIAGAIAVGKTTLARNLGYSLDFHVQEETVEGHPCLETFYEALRYYQDKKMTAREMPGSDAAILLPIAETNLHYWSFATQSYFLWDRLHKHNSALMSDRGVIADRSIYEDGIFARMLAERGEMDMTIYERVYLPHFLLACSWLRPPSLVVYLQASTDTLMARKAERDREMECSIPREYMDSLNQHYDAWFDGFYLPAIKVNAENPDLMDPKSDDYKLLANKIVCRTMSGEAAGKAIDRIMAGVCVPVIHEAA